MLGDLLGAISFFTIAGRGHPPREGSRYWFALAGASIGCVSGIVWVLTVRHRFALVGAVVTVIVIVAASGAIHFDGLADASDGLLAHLSLERRFEIMSSPEVGSFGIVSVVISLMLITASLEELTPNILLLVGLMSLSRTLSALAMEYFTYAKIEGIVSGFGGSPSLFGRTRLVLAGELLVSVALLVAAVGLGGLVVGAVGVIVQLVVLLRARSLLGGYTGDVLGAAIVASEALGLAVAVLVQR